MATQDGSGIPFEVHHDQQNCRLLELPLELLGVITAKNPPSLILKSIAASASSPANAVLCTDAKTYQVRQVHSSNSIFVLQPSEITLNTSDEDGVPMAGLSAIARCATTLELIPATLPAVSLLKDNLHIFNGPQTEQQGEQTAEIIGDSDRRSRLALYDDIPLSKYEFESAWIEICAFELDSASWVPTASCLSGVWRSIFSAAILKGLDLQDSIYINDLVGLVEEDGYPAGLLQAVVERLQVEKAIPMEGWAALSVDKCIPWVGAIVLASRSALLEGMDITDFLREWKNLLPEGWRQHAVLDRLDGKYSLPSKGRILPKATKNQADSAGSAKSLNPSGRKPGKWHEKFKRG